jgi:hypothetical protein
MKSEFIPYEHVSSLIALGFNEPVIAHRQHGLDICLLKQPEVLLTDLSMILYQQAFRWFREKYNLLSEIGLRDREDLSTWKFEITIIGKYEMKHNSISYNTHEEAELACLTKLIEIVELNT